MDGWMNYLKVLPQVEARAHSWCLILCFYFENTLDSLFHDRVWLSASSIFFLFIATSLHSDCDKLTLANSWKRSFFSASDRSIISTTMQRTHFSLGMLDVTLIQSQWTGVQHLCVSRGEVKYRNPPSSPPMKTVNCNNTQLGYQCNLKQ